MSIFANIPGKIEKAKYWLSTARKAVVPVVAGVVSLLSIPTLGVSPEVVAAVIAVATALGVYVAPNVPQEPQDVG